MDLATLKPMIDWISANPTWAGLAVFVISLSESLAIVGLFIPGVAVMFGIGALIATGALDLWATLAWAVAGAIVGDGLSYWLGYHYKDALRERWPFRRYPALLARGERFFQRHGGKSVIFGRFVGPVRPVIPVVAGMLGMPPGRFLLVNVISALAWAPAYTLPGVVFGASLNLASEVASRLAMLLLTVLLSLWLTVWLIYRIYRLLAPRASVIMDRLLAWGDEHRYAGKLVSSVLDPEQPEWRGLAVLAGLLVSLAVGLITVGRGLFDTHLITANITVFNFMQGLRVPWADRIMVFLAELSDSPVTLPVTAAVMIWLAWRHRWLALLHVAGAVAFALILTLSLGWSMATPPGDATVGTGGGIVINSVLYGLLAVMVAHGMRGQWRWLPYGVTGLFMVSLILAQLYLGLTWVSNAVAGWLLALLWVVVLGAAYRRHSPVPVPPRHLILITFTALLISATAYMSSHYRQDLIRHTPRHNIEIFDTAHWWSDAWRTLPAYRIDLEGHAKQPLSVQWAGPLDILAAQLKTQGWQDPPALTSTALLHWLLPSPSLAELPLLPQVHDGHHDALRLVRGTADGQWVVLRLWRSDFVLQQPSNPLWVGTVTTLRAARPLPLFTMPLTGDEFNTPLNLLETSLGDLPWRAVHHSDELNTDWDGTLLLIRAPFRAGPS